MAAVSIRDLDDEVKQRLRVRAANNGRSMEAEVREILRDAVAVPDRRVGLGQALLNRFAAIGGAEAELPLRGDRPRASHLDD